jgi:hypothetical protein
MVKNIYHFTSAVAMPDLSADIRALAGLSSKALHLPDLEHFNRQPAAAHVLPRPAAKASDWA